MKQIVVVSLLFAVLGVRAGHAAEVEAVSRIDAVTVYPMGAEVMRVAKVQLEKGEHTILFQDLPAGAVEGSIRVEGSATGKLEIGSVDTRRMFVPRADAQAAATEQRQVELEIEQLRDERSVLEAQVAAAETQKQLITNLTQLPTRPAPAAGADKGEDWAAVLALISAGSAEAQRSLRDAQSKMRDVDRKIADLENKLGSLAPERTERTEAKVFVVTQSALEADITLRYQVVNASWTPLYDVRLATGGKTVAPKIDISRRAAINQKTGESWDNIALTLSTTRPTAGAAAPELRPLIVDFEPEPRAPVPPPATAPAPMGGAFLPEDGLSAAAPQAEMAEEADGRVEMRARVKKAVIEERPADVVQAPFHALYAVPGRLTIPDTGESKRVQLGSDTMEPQLTVRAVPKVDAKAFLYAKFNVPKGTPLLPGTASLFRDGTFVGTGRLPILSPGEEHELGFGIDDLVRVRYAVAAETRGETGLISTSRTDNRNYLLSIKSMHERAIALAVFDQIPVSANQDIKVDLTGNTSPTKQNVDDKRGVLMWEGKLEPDQERTIEFGYRVSWPSARSIQYRQ
ncbi:MAG: mucoidy inhibitor MuiA family protein [Hyphomicrobium sp.]|uniref:mucoidy inhibitor MuiA family protein n=1 Tax=Hyphomicrobium sp. TaxID=82 RepID=UPI0025C65BFB|nr:mucoidy inhibitor MuiA family protein [Hyphomicrobium sp.]MBX9862796.1 mucoidy inhibitor MuiA family protein [Hyphomicrobium sp.]